MRIATARILRRSALSLVLAAAFPAAAAEPAPDNAQLYEIIQQLRTEVQTLKARLDAQQGVATAPAANAQLQKTVEAQQAQIDALAEASDAKAKPGSSVNFGGYGELHYSNLSADDESQDLRELDLHRVVLFIGNEFSDRLRFRSELEVEHTVAADGAGGEVELEQAYLEYDYSSALTLRGGAMLMPVGIINETHEPPTFYGVERNDVETIIVPATWWGGGAAATLRFGAGWQWDLMLSEGLKVPTIGGNAFAVRSGRQNTSNADASDLAYTTRLRYSGIPGLELAGSLHYETDISQVGGDGLDEGLLYTVNAVFSRGPFALRALYGGWTLSGDAVEQADADSQKGWYIEPSYKLVPALGVYARYEDIDAGRLQDRFTEWEGGFNYYPFPQIVLKADFRSRTQELDSESGLDFQGFDLGLGYMF